MTKVSDSYPNNQALTDAEIKQMLIAKYDAGETKQMPVDGNFEKAEPSKFHTEVVTLPSQGLLYDPNNTLSSGQVEMKYMTAKEEDILTSQNLIKQGVVIDKLLQSLIVGNINYDSLILGDKNALLIAARVLAYGKDYEVQITCPACDEKSNQVVDLTSFDDKPAKEGSFTPGRNEFQFELPNSKRMVTFKCLTSGDEKAIENELKALKKVAKITGVDPDMTTRLKYIITSVDGNDDKKFIRQFIDNELLSKDSLALRKYIQEVIPDIDMSFYFECPHCSHEEVSMAMPLTVSFFWPRA